MSMTTCGLALLDIALPWACIALLVVLARRWWRQDRAEQRAHEAWLARFRRNGTGEG